MKNNRDLSKCIFLLGGHDLEMCTIKTLLTKAGCAFCDYNLSWETAYLSAYSEELEKHPDFDVFGIELQEDIVPPVNYHRIDHHNSLQCEPSSLAQVAALIGHSLTPEEVLVSVNDCYHIRGLRHLKEELRPSEQKIREIRLADRRAQGITEEDDTLKPLSMEWRKGLLVVKADERTKFSSIYDRIALHELIAEDRPLKEFDSVMVFNENKEVCIYGVLSRFADAWLCSNEIPHYSGGGEYGFTGVSLKADWGQETPEALSAFLSCLFDSGFSAHIFLLPFRWDSKRVPTPQKNVWKRVCRNADLSPADQAVLYNEKQYFHHFVHPALYDDGKGTTLVLHYEMALPAPDSQNAKYIIEHEAVQYSLDIEAINVNLYSTGVGILSLHLINRDPSHASPQDILSINQYGRRIMPPFYKDIHPNEGSSRQELADIISLQGLPYFNVIKEDFKSFNVKSVWKPGCFVVEILKSVLGESQQDWEMQPIVDDRMFVLTWYKNGSEVDNLKGKTDCFDPTALNTGRQYKDFWYRFLFIDNQVATCQNKEMYASLLRQHSYLRWENWSSFYGVSRYSMVMLTSETCPTFLTDYFSSMYARMAELCLVQRSSILVFSKRLSNLKLNGSEIGNEADELYDQHLDFVNHFLFSEVTAQDQGIELYGLLRQTLSTEEFDAILKEQLHNTQERIKALGEEATARQLNMLNLITGIAFPLTVIISLVGLFQIQAGPNRATWVALVIALCLGVIASLSMNWYIHKRKK